MENKINQDTIFELKKDISTPSEYLRAGKRLTKKEWENLFPNCLNSFSNEWFIDPSVVPTDADYTPIEWKIINEVFEKQGLHSLSYKGATAQCMREYRKLLQK